MKSAPGTSGMDEAVLAAAAEGGKKRILE